MSEILQGLRIQNKVPVTPSPVRMISSFQTSFLVGIMKQKGYGPQSRILKIITDISTVEFYADVTFNEARYLIMRLPSISRNNIDAYLAGRASLNDVGLPPYNRRLTRYK